jgi:hypothetical protein
MARKIAGTCDGAGDANGDHCCWLEGVECPFLERDTIEGRHYACGLRRELGSWDRVHADARYLTVVRPIWDRCGVVDCGQFVGLNRRGTGEPQCCFARTR